MSVLIYMKYLVVALLCAGLTSSCTQHANYKTEREEVMKFHDILMEDNSTLVNNGMKIDSLMKNLPALKASFKELDTAKEKEVMRNMVGRLNKAEELMNDWMHTFEPDITGKSNEQAVTYFKAERIKIGKIDSLYKQEIKSSTDYLLKFKR